MSDRDAKAVSYRERAAKIRPEAEGVVNQEMKKSLLHLAENYDQLAQAIEVEFKGLLR